MPGPAVKGYSWLREPSSRASLRHSLRTDYFRFLIRMPELYSADSWIEVHLSRRMGAVSNKGEYMRLLAPLILAAAWLSPGGTLAAVDCASLDPRASVSEKYSGKITASKIGRAHV